MLEIINRKVIHPIGHILNSTIFKVSTQLAHRNVCLCICFSVKLRKRNQNIYLNKNKKQTNLTLLCSLIKEKRKLITKQITEIKFINKNMYIFIIKEVKLNLDYLFVFILIVVLFVVIVNLY